MTHDTCGENPSRPYAPDICAEPERRTKEIVERLAELDVLPGLPPADGDHFEVRLRERLLAEAGGLEAYKAALVKRLDGR